MSKIAVITIGPSESDDHAVDWALSTADGDGYLSHEDGSYYQLAACRHPTTPDGWARAARRHATLPAGCSWADADVRPIGCSDGSGVAPGGVTITWRRSDD